MRGLSSSAAMSEPNTANPPCTRTACGFISRRSPNLRPRRPGPPGRAHAKEGGASPLTDLGGEKIDRIVARGQVRFVQEDRVATSQEAIYYKDKEEVVLLGNPQMWRGENTLKGERIVFNLKNNTMKVESSPQKRVEAHLYSTAKGMGGKGEKAKKGKGEKGK
ncbi:MAG: hypothetical protein FJ126_07630 [Deltaproteobacteria bacterium]|nr:hypothetical protein [Deltaproteobacteria bacterium]